MSVSIATGVVALDPTNGEISVITPGTAFRGPDGTNLVPTFSFTSEPGLGFYRQAPATMGLAGAFNASGPITGTTITATTKFLSAAGTPAAPTYAFSGASPAGITGLSYNGSANGIIEFSANGSLKAWVHGNNVFGLAATTTLGWGTETAEDLFLARDAANTLALKNGNSAQDFHIYAGNGGFMSVVKTVNESLTIAAAATTVGATSIPAGAILLSVAVRVTTVIPTAVTFTVTTTVGGTTLNTAAVSTAANSTDKGTAAGASFRSAATTVTITPNVAPATATGVVRLTYYYIDVTPPTS